MSDTKCDFSEFLISWREALNTPCGSDYSPFDHWRISHVAEAERWAKLVGSWSSGTTYLELRYANPVDYGRIKERYDDMCATWRRITNGRLRSRGTLFGGLRAVEFFPLRTTDTGTSRLSRVDVCFRVVCDSRKMGLTLLLEWLKCTNQNPQYADVYEQNKKPYRYSHIIEFGDTITTPTRGNMWRFISEHLDSTRVVSFDFGCAMLGFRDIALERFGKYADSDFVWYPNFRYVYIKPFGKCDLKYKGTNRKKAPSIPADVSFREDKFVHVVALKAPPRVDDIRRCFGRVPQVRFRSSELEFMLFQELDFNFEKTMRLASRISAIFEKYESIIRDSIVDSLSTLFDCPDYVRGVDKYWEQLQSERINLQKRIKWLSARKLPTKQDELRLDAVNRELGRFVEYDELVKPDVKP